jgi:hypothetical protein
MLPEHLIINDRHNEPKELDPDKFIYRWKSWLNIY